MDTTGYYRFYVCSFIILASLSIRFVDVACLVKDVDGLAKLILSMVRKRSFGAAWLKGRNDPLVGDVLPRPENKRRRQ